MKWHQVRHVLRMITESNIKQGEEAKQLINQWTTSEFATAGKFGGG